MSDPSSAPWLSIPLDDYEGHMSAAEVGQLSVLADLFRSVVLRHRPASVLIAGVAGGNGLEAIDSSITQRVVGLDINEQYLLAVKRRFPTLPGLELYACDLTSDRPDVRPVALAHAALLFEHTGLDPALDNVLSLVVPGGVLSVVLQLPSTATSEVAPTRFISLQSVKDRFALIDVNRFQHEMATRGLRLTSYDHRPLPAGKGFWLGVFQRIEASHAG